MEFMAGVFTGAVLGASLVTWLVREFREAKAHATGYDPFPEKSPDGRIYEEERSTREASRQEDEDLAAYTSPPYEVSEEDYDRLIKRWQQSPDDPGFMD